MAKVFMNGRSQAVRLPKEFRFGCKVVFVQKEGNDLVLSPKTSEARKGWGYFLKIFPVLMMIFLKIVKIFRLKSENFSDALHARYRYLELYFQETFHYRA